MLKDPGWYLLAPAPGCGIVMQDGTFVVPVQGRDSSQRFFSTIMTSVAAYGILGAHLGQQRCRWLARQRTHSFACINCCVFVWMVAMVEGSVELLKKYLFEHGCGAHCSARCRLRKRSSDPFARSCEAPAPIWCCAHRLCRH